MALVFLGLGTNLGDKQQNLTDAVTALGKVGQIIKQSGLYTSEPWGFESENAFLNAVVLFKTELSPMDLLAATQEIERNLGRIAKTVTGYADRLIDIDILLYDNIILNETELKIPHPLITERDFVLIPLVEIAPDVVNPLTGVKYSKTILPE